MRSTWAQAVASSWSRSLATRVSKACEDARLVEAAHGDDEGEAELRLVGVVELGEAGALGVGQGVEAGAGLLGGGLGRQALRGGELAGEVGVGLEDGEALLRAGGAEGAGEGVGEADGGVVGGAELEVEGALGDPGGVLEDAAEAGDEGVLRQGGGALGDGRARGGGRASGRRSRPRVAIQTLRLGLDVGEEGGEALDAAGAADEAAVEADGHHLRASRPRLRRRGCRRCRGGR